MRYRLGDVFQEEIEKQLDEYKRAVDRRVCAEIDAGACQTKQDYRRRDDMLDAESKTRESVEMALLALIERALNLAKAGIIVPVQEKQNVGN